MSAVPSICDMATSDAACSCGQLRLTVGGEPRAITMCHCLACQRRTGSVVSVQAIYRPAQVEIAGRYSEYVRLAEDDDQRRYCFCPDCGATVFFTVTFKAWSKSRRLFCQNWTCQRLTARRRAVVRTQASGEA